MSFFAITVNCQTIYRGVENNKEIKIERVDGGFGAIFLDCFKDSLTSELYTGQVVCVFHGIPRDTINVVDGKVEHCAKMYRVFLNYPTEKLEFIYVIRSEPVQLELIVQQEKKGNTVYLFAKQSNGDTFFYDFIFKSGKWFIQRVLIVDEKRKKRKFRLEKDQDIYQFLKAEDLFPESVIEEIKEQKLLEQHELSFYFGRCD